ncbi:LOW QUALITY PROTEIN: uncharacterized protein Dere_GG25191 [Drosophila erecta]|uniref:Protein CDV3 homolog n=1 Tax=Drosophila erecta TaxID=7220 RepID=B3N642_DROER|nr:LOW QUALITY PROTEIN: uncharacterized protein Dere_GG25191 [Drosophila erecta]
MSSLDDFFAKKDNKKCKKKKPNYLATDELYKTLEESSKLVTDADSEKCLGNESRAEGPTESSGSALKPLEFRLLYSNESVEGEDEWCDFTEENRMEYMSLRRSIETSLGSTALVQLAGGEVKVQDSEQHDNAGDGIDVGQALIDGMGSTTCPWRKMGRPLEQQELKDLSEQNPVEQPKKEEPSEAKSQIYIPPALRQSQGDFNQRAELESRLVPTKMSGKPQAPDLNSADYFPSLSGAKPFRRTK